MFVVCGIFLNTASFLAFEAFGWEQQKSTRCAEFLATSYSVDNGLPTNLVKDVVQDKRGFVWLATDAGLVRFDGFRFLTVQHDLPSHYVKRVFLRRNGTLLALTDMGLAEIHTQMDSVSITTILQGSQIEQPNMLHYAKSLFEDAHGTLWFGEKQAVVRWRGGKLQRYQFPEKCNSTNVVLTFSFAEDESGTLLAFSYQGFCFRYNPQKDLFEEIPLPQNFGTFSHCATLRKGEFIVAAEKGLLRFSFPEGSTTPTVSYKELVSGMNKVSALYLSKYTSKYPANNVSSNKVSSNEISSSKISSDAQGSFLSPTLYIGTWYNGVIRTDTTLANPLPIRNLEPQRIKSFFEDKHGNLWICGDQGLMFLERAMMRFVEGFTVAALDVGTTVQSRNGLIYTLNGEAMYEVEPEFGQARLVWEKPVNAGLLYALAPDSKGGVWIGTLSGLLVNWRNGAVQRTVQLNNGSTERGIFALTEDKQGNLWGCVFYQRLSVFCLEPNGTIRYYGEQHGITTTAQCIRCADDGTIVVGTSGNPQEYVFRYNPDNDRFDNISAALPQPGGSYKLNIYDIAFDPVNPHTYWLASSVGLIRLSGTTVELPFANNPEIMNTVGKAITIEQNGTIWIGTDNGILRYTPTAEHKQRAAFLQQPSGLISRTISFRGMLFDAHHRLWVATNNGLYSMNTSNAALETPSPTLVQATMNGNRINFAALPESFSSESYIQLFLAVFVPAPHTAVFRYRIYAEGSTKPAWSHPSQDPVVSLANLEAGTFILEIAARREGTGELWSKPLTARFSVKPVWYWSWWAFVLYALAGASLVGTATLGIVARRDRNRVALEQQARRHLQEMVQHRTREITHQKELLETQTMEIQSTNAELLRANDELHHTNEALKEANTFKTRMISIVSHDLKNPLGSMLGLAKIMESEAESPEQQGMARDMSKLAAQMLDLVKELLDSAAMEAGKIELQKTLLDVGELVSAVVWQYRSVAEQKHQHIFLGIEAQCTLEGDPHRLRQVFENLISNAVKYSPPGKSIYVTLEHCPKTSLVATSAAVAAQSCIRFAVRDEGPGLTPDDIKKAFGHFQRLSAKPTAGESSSGVGLAIVKQISELHGGRVWIESNVGNGATFIVELPAVSVESVE